MTDVDRPVISAFAQMTGAYAGIHRAGLNSVHMFAFFPANVYTMHRLEEQYGF